MRTWRDMSEDEQAELLLSGMSMCQVCGGHGTIQMIPAGVHRPCVARGCDGKGYGDKFEAAYLQFWEALRRGDVAGPTHPRGRTKMPQVQGYGYKAVDV